MKLLHRKFAYSILALGSLYLALLAVINVWFGLIIFSTMPLEGALRILASSLGLFGFFCAWASIALLPSLARRSRLILAGGIMGGFCAVLMAVAMEIPLEHSAWGVWEKVAFVYVLCGTGFTGLALLAELMLGSNNFFKPTPLRGAA